MCHRKREPRGADGGSFVLEQDGQPATHRRCLDACNTYYYIYTLFRDTKKNIEQNNSAGVALQPIILAKTALISSIISDCNAKPNMADADSIGTSIFFFTNLVICR